MGKSKFVIITRKEEKLVYVVICTIFYTLNSGNGRFVPQVCEYLGDWKAEWRKFHGNNQRCMKLLGGRIVE